jgi:hypothetical protein
MLKIENTLVKQVKPECLGYQLKPKYLGLRNSTWLGHLGRRDKK